MKELRLVSLELNNFMGIKYFKLDTKNSNEVYVFGKNGSGKTSLESAYQWLLFDKDADGRSNFEVKTLDQDGNAIHGLEHSVEGVFTLNGKPLTLRKVFMEKWTKRRGQAKEEFTGHTTDYFVEGVPVQKKEYVAAIEGIASEETFKLLTSPTYFNSLHWEKRRAILMDVCGDVSDEYVIKTTPKLKDLPKILNGKTAEQYKKIVAAKRKEINAELDKLPVRINEVQRGLPTTKKVDPEKLQEEIARLKGEIQVRREKAAGVNGGGEIAVKVKELRELEGELIALRNQQSGKTEEEISSLRTLKRTYVDALDDAQGDINRYRRTIQQNLSSIGGLEADMKGLRAKWTAVNSESFAFDQEDTCPTCGQDLPAEQLQEAREKAEAAFNVSKSERLAEINRQGKSMKDKAKELQAENEGMEEAIEEAKVIVMSNEKEITALDKKLQVLLNTEAPKPSAAMVKAEKAIAKLQAEIESMKADSEVAATSIKGEIADLEAELEAMEEARAEIKAAEQGKERIKELKAQERTLAAEFEKIEGELYLLEEFTRAKVALVEENVSSKFKYARFKLFEVQVNGGIKEVCETLYKGVPYGTNLNRAARMNIGLDIINTLADYYRFSAPIMIDNREAVSKIIGTKGQQINLLVSEKDSTLRVVTELD